MEGKVTISINRYEELIQAETKLTAIVRMIKSTQYSTSDDLLIIAGASGDELFRDSNKSFTEMLGELEEEEE